jgi:uncharacterized protein YdeI (YjbR/CyaY-like superfamily)
MVLGPLRRVLAAEPSLTRLSKPDAMDPVFFPAPEALRKWLHDNHASAAELWVGLHKKHTGRPSITWGQLVDEVLCFGWIDGLRRSVDDERYAIRITPRTATSTWSRVNTRRARELIEEGRMAPAGQDAFERRDTERSAEYSFERGRIALDRAYEVEFRESVAAWEFFVAQAPSYRKAAVAWVMTAKREETRLRRLRTLISDSEKGLRVGPFRRSS